MFKNHRNPQDPDANVIKLSGPDFDIFFLVNSGGIVEIERDTIILNGSYNEQFMAKNMNVKAKKIELNSTDCYGTVTENNTLSLTSQWFTNTIAPGGMVQVKYN
ncbi:hypothetical protein D3C76_1628340 [compost metagenome]